MNVAYNRTLKQSQSVQRELAAFESARTTDDVQEERILEGLRRLQRHIEEYDTVTKRELNPEKQKTGFARVQKFRDDYFGMKQTFDRAKHQAHTRAMHHNERDQLLQQTDAQSESTTINMADFSQREADFADYADQQLDTFIAQGRSALNNLVEQRGILKGTQRRILDAANTLGLSRSVIQYIERRSTQDKFIFFAGVIVCIFLMWAIIHYLG
ncbi:hypothetical protein THASP1DRAFT_29582 [Thamnocephalis sphaerospora]|uniref:Protein transport protein BOS1 n=1 Tax=Thamnocephalis sphaerospora TaxID=78915 RepID=A0A4P9XRB3_9FUNG|nr:hypothetical protein THASP1DRAFT_29582 [Thamnocephalis sphaerospora]|eukprot:RKP08615.1 hypothetical protein THASP1DRAFT_29582 [Thamnocephalis sphaerospora]